MPTPFCQRCYEKALADLKKQHGDDKRFSLDVKGMNFSCQIPIYESDDQGRPTVSYWDCERKVKLHCSLKEWERMKRDGEV